MLKKLFAFFGSAFVILPVVASVENPEYIELQPHISNVNYKPSYLSNGVTASSVETTGVNFHIAIGYQLSKNFAGELGVLWAHWPIYRNLQPPPNHKVKNNVLYLGAKYGVTIGPHWELYGKVAVGSVARLGFSVAGAQMFSTKLIVTPVVGLGTYYKINSRWSVDLSWMGALPQNSQKLPWSNFFGLGLRYQFTF